MFSGDMEADLCALFTSVQWRIQELDTPGKKERIQAIAALRRHGIVQTNTNILAEGGNTRDLMCERSAGGKVLCSR